MPTKDESSAPTNPMQVFKNLLIVVVVDQDQQIVDYRVDELDDVVADLALRGFGKRPEAA